MEKAASQNSTCKLLLFLIFISRHRTKQNYQFTWVKSLQFKVLYQETTFSFRQKLQRTIICYKLIKLLVITQKISIVQIKKRKKFIRFKQSKKVIKSVFNMQVQGLIHALAKRNLPGIKREKVCSCKVIVSKLRAWSILKKSTRRTLTKTK